MDNVKKKYVVEHPIFEKVYCPVCGSELICPEYPSTKSLLDLTLNPDKKQYEHLCLSCNKSFYLDKPYPFPIDVYDEEVDLEKLNTIMSSTTQEDDSTNNLVS